MATQPLFYLNVDGSLTTKDLRRTTSRLFLSLKGSVPPNSVDVQINLNNTGYVSDPDLLDFNATEFQIPNPLVYPEGLPVNFGTVTAQVRAVDVLGNVTIASMATIDIIRPSQLLNTISGPTGLSVRRRLDSVEVVWVKNPETSVIGYNLYASSVPAGGLVGYTRINADLIATPSFQREEVFPLGSSTVLYTQNRGTLHQVLVEEDFDQTVLQVVADQTFDTEVSGPLIKVSTTVTSVDPRDYFMFTHNRSFRENQGTLGFDLFSAVSSDTPLYYVITALSLNEVTGEETESPYSAELPGLPLAVGSTTIAERRLRTRYDATRDYIDQILRTNNEISTIPGSVVRDIFIDPFTSEVQRLHFIADFLDRSLSFLTLLQIDDLNRNGASDPVSANAYKRALKSALGVPSDSELQALLDDRFAKLASNYDVVRLGATTSIGEVLFVTNAMPQDDVVFSVGVQVATTGTPAVTFETTSRITLPFASRASYFNIRERRYEIRAPIQAITQGEVGNISPNQIQLVIGGPSGWRAVNPERTFLGRDVESNNDLANRAILALSSVDAGTGSGYLATALGTPGVFRASVVKSGDVYMQRDYDPIRNKHIGGKVDVWIQGQRSLTVSDRFALGINIGQNVQFYLDSSPTDLIFVADDLRLSPTTPILEMLGKDALEQAQGFFFRNATTGLNFNLQGVLILDYNRIQLNTAIAQPAINVTDIVRGSYRFQSQTSYFFTRQPVQSVNSVSSIGTGDSLTEGVQYMLVQSQDPLLEGRSSLARDYIDITPVNGIPSGATFVVNDERHVLVGEEREPLFNLGANPITLRVFSLDRTLEYDGPFAGNATPDYFVQNGDATNPLRIIRNEQGRILNGQELSVDYTHDENFSVSYTINQILTDVQIKTDVRSHVTADVIVKDSISVPVDVEMTVVLRRGADRNTVDADLVSSVSSYFNARQLADSVYQSDVIRAVEQVDGVDYVVVPFARMALASGALVVREALSNNGFFLQQTGAVKTFVLADTLSSATRDGGGVSNRPRGVYEDTQALVLTETLNFLYQNAGSALIIGGEGRVIPGYSDDLTLTSQGFNTPAERSERRKALTSNRVLVSVTIADTVANHEYAVTYISFNDMGSTDVNTNAVSYPSLGALTVTYR